MYHYIQNQQSRLVIIWLLSALLFAWTSCEVFYQEAWCDELMTIWVTKDGIKETFDRSFTTQGSTPFYFLIAWSMVHLMGINPEISLRILSLVCIVVAVIYIYRFCRCYLSVEASSIVTQFFVILCRSQTICFSGRPYALGLMFAAISIDSFTRWVLYSKRREFLCCIAASVFIPYIHLLFVCLFSVHVIIAILYRSELQKRLSIFFVLSILLFYIVSILPILYQAKLQIDSSNYHGLVYSKYSSIVTFLAVGASIRCLATWFLFLPLVFWITKNEEYRQNSKFLVIGLTLAFSSLFLLSLGSFISGNMLVITRYYCYSIAGIAMVAGLLVSTIEKDSVRICACVYVILGGIYIFRIDFGENWRTTFKTLEQYRKASDILLIDPGLPQMISQKWVTNPKGRDYWMLFSSYYGPNLSFLMFPFELDKASLIIQGRQGNTEEDNPTLWLISYFGARMTSVDAIETNLKRIGYRIIDTWGKNESVKLFKCEKDVTLPNT